MTRRTKVALAAALGISIGVSVLVGSPQGGTMLSTGAQGSDAAAAAGSAPPAGHRAHVPAPEVRREEVTRPGDGQDYAVFRNGQVHKVRTRTRTFIVHHADGTQGTVIKEEGDIESQLPPVDHRFDHLRPTEAQKAEMATLVGVRAAP